VITSAPHGIRALIVDDEPLARRGIRARLARFADFEVAGECANGRDAITAIETLAPDLVFLDVQMPGTDGFAVVRDVGAERMPMVVFVTAHDAHALRAFDVHALDYLLKPIDDDRFAEAIGRVRLRATEREESALGRRLAALLATVGQHGQVPRREARLAIKDRGRVVLLGEGEVDWVEADGDYVRIHAGGKHLLLRETMTAMEARLDASRFARIHRSALVNLARVRELRPHGTRDSVVVLSDGTLLKLSRSCRERFQAALTGSR
jgi:two-component system, LytTR family, response regulator